MSLKISKQVNSHRCGRPDRRKNCCLAFQVGILRPEEAKWLNWIGPSQKKEQAEFSLPGIRKGPPSPPQECNCPEFSRDHQSQVFLSQPQETWFSWCWKLLCRQPGEKSQQELDHMCHNTNFPCKRSCHSAIVAHQSRG